jgi:hypothetical protein
MNPTIDLTRYEFLVKIISMGKWKTGHSEETKRKISKGLKRAYSLGIKTHTGMTGKKHSPETILKMQASAQLRMKKFGKPQSGFKRGAEHWNWKNGSSTERQRLINQTEYKEWRTAVFERDNYTCQNCGARSGNGKEVILNADHIKEWSNYPELRYDVNNGRTLCESCHRETPNFGLKAWVKK